MDISGQCDLETLVCDCQSHQEGAAFAAEQSERPQILTRNPQCTGVCICGESCIAFSLSLAAA